MKMLDSVPPQCWRIVPLVIGGLFIASGIGMIASGIVILSRANDKDDVLGFAEAGMTTGGTVSIYIGVGDLITGAVGLVVALLNKKWLVYVYAGLLAIMILGNMFIFFVLTMSNAEDWRESTATLKNLVIHLYGNNSRTDGQKFTTMVDTLQSGTPCCGFSGDETDNVFLKTSWYLRFNVDKAKPQTLPDTCCATRADECRFTGDLRKARDGGYVHKKDCTSELYKAYSRQMILACVEVSLSTLMQVISAVFTAFLIIHGQAGATN